MGKIKIEIPAQTIEAAATVEQVKKTSTKKATPKKATTSKRVTTPRNPQDTTPAPFLASLNPQFADCELFHYYGKSMEPILHSGDILIVKEEIAFCNFQPGALYLMHRAQGYNWEAFVGYLKPQTSYFELLPENSKFDKVMIERRNAGHIYRVLGKFSFNL